MAFEAQYPHTADFSLARDARRAALFRETLPETVERIALGTAWALHPRRIAGLPALGFLYLADLVAPDDELPDPNRPLNAAGLCGLVHDPSAVTLIEGYKHGLFSFAHFGPLKWLSLPERCVLFFDDFHIATNVRRFLRQGRYTVTFDRDFDAVVKACAGRRNGRRLTWITPRIMRLYRDLFDAGHAHSVEVWNRNGELAGGSFGLAIGRAFFGESQFSGEAHTSKIAMTALVWHLAKWGYAFADGKWETPTMRDMGFKLVPRADFLRHVDRAVHGSGHSGRWRTEVDLPEIAAWKRQASAA